MQRIKHLKITVIKGLEFSQTLPKISAISNLKISQNGTKNNIE
jgi:hypothetical protein